MGSDDMLALIVNFEKLITSELQTSTCRQGGGDA